MILVRTSPKKQILLRGLRLAHDGLVMQRLHGHTIAMPTSLVLAQAAGGLTTATPYNKM